MGLFVRETSLYANRVELPTNEEGNANPQHGQHNQDVLEKTEHLTPYLSVQSKQTARRL